MRKSANKARIRNAGHLCLRGSLCALALLVFFIPLFAKAQGTVLSYDPAGNLTQAASSGLSAPLIVAQPLTPQVSAGANVGLSVTASGASVLSYQWLFNGQIIAGANSDSLLLTNVNSTTLGIYSVIISDASGSVTSAPVVVSFDPGNDGLPTAAPSTFSLSLNTFQGIITANPSLSIYTNQQQVTLTAIPDAGQSFLGWSGDETGTNNPLTITMGSNMCVSAAFGLNLGYAVNASQLVWTPGGQEGWFGETNTSYDGVAAAQSGPIGAGQESWLETTNVQTGFSTVSFWWQTVCGSTSNAMLQLFINGAPQPGALIGTNNWQQEEFFLTPGTNILLWVFSNTAPQNPYFADAYATGWLDEVTFQSVSTIPLGQAVTATNLEWTSFGNAEWFGENYFTHDNASAAAQSGPVGLGQQSVLLTTNVMLADGTISFWWNISAGSGSGSMSFAVNDAVQATLTGNSGWQSNSFFLAAGTNVLEWDYEQGPTMDLTSSNAAWLDQVTTNTFENVNFETFALDSLLYRGSRGDGYNDSAYYEFAMNDSNSATAAFSGGSGDGYFDSTYYNSSISGGIAQSAPEIYFGSVGDGYDDSPIYNVDFLILPPWVPPAGPPVITGQPQGQIVNAGQSVTFNVSAIGTPSPDYQWQLNGVNVPGAVGPTLSISDAQAGNAGSYQVIVYNEYGATNSDVAALDVASIQQSSPFVPVGGTDTVSVAVAGPGSFSYQWLFDGTNIINPNIITTVAGNGSAGYSGDGGAATNASLNLPSEVAVDASGNLYIADTDNNRIRKVDANGIITTVAGSNTNGYAGDGGTATNASLNFPSGVGLDVSGDVFIADTENYRIREVDANSIITTVAGGGGGIVNVYSGEGGAATNASLGLPYSVAVDGLGDLFIESTVTILLPPYNNRLVGFISKVGTDGIFTTVAGGSQGYSGDGGAATNASFNNPKGIALDASGNLFIADTDNSCIRRVDTNGIITTVAGNLTNSFSGDGGMATNASLNLPSGVAVDASGDLFIADTDNNRIRKVDTNGIITTVAGNASQGYSGDGGAATNASLNLPSGVTVDASGDLLIADTANDRIREVTPPNGPMLTLTNVGFANVGTYSVVISSPYGTITNNAVMLTLVLQYDVTDLGTLGGLDSEAYGINNSGQIVGYSLTSSGYEHAFLYSGGTMTDLGTLGGSDSTAEAINNSGQVVGDAYTSSGNQHAFLYSGGTMADLGALLAFPDSYAIAINNSGQVVVDNDNDGPAYLYSGGTMADLGSFGGSASYAAAINNSGQVAGYASTGGINYYAFLYNGGTMTNLGALENGAYSDATAINNSGQVVGWADVDESGYYHAFLSSGGTPADLGSLVGPYGNSAAQGVNNAGQIIGYSDTSSGNQHAFLYSGGTMTDLGMLTGGSYSYPSALNNSGQVVGYADTSSGVEHAFLYTGGTMFDLNNSINTNSIGTFLSKAVLINDLGMIVAEGANNHAYLLTPVSRQGSLQSLEPSPLQNPSFEIPVVGPTNSFYSFEYDPTGADWTFTGNAGIAANGSGYMYYAPHPYTPYGNQFAFLEGALGIGGTMSQTISNLTAGQYSFTFYSSLRQTVGTEFQTQTQTVTVLMDGTNVGSFSPPDTNWYSYQTTPIQLAAGNHVLAFTNLPTAGDAAAFVDMVGVVGATNASLPSVNQFIQPTIQTTPLSGGNFTFNWNLLPAYPPVGYQVQYTTNLLGTWVNIGAVITNGVTSFVTTIGTNSQGFYRVQLVQ